MLPGLFRRRRLVGQLIPPFAQLFQKLTERFLLEKGIELLVNVFAIAEAFVRDIVDEPLAAFINQVIVQSERLCLSLDVKSRGNVSFVFLDLDLVDPIRGVFPNVDNRP